MDGGTPPGEGARAAQADAQRPPHTTTDGHTLSRWRIAAFALPAAPIAAMGLPVVVYLPPFYADQLGLGLPLVGFIFMMTRFWDVFTDPVLGIISDKWKTRWGRRRHWIVASVPIMLVSVVMVFMPVAPVSGTYLIWWMVVLYVGWTLLTISHLSWGAELTPDYRERSTVQGFREIALLAGMIFVLVLPVFIESVSSGDKDAVAYQSIAAMGWYVLILLPIAVVVAVWFVPERDVPPPQHIPMRQAIGIILRNHPLRVVLACDLASGISGGIVTGLFLFLARDVLQLANASVLILVYLTSGAVFLPLMLKISHLTSKHRALSYSSILSAVTVPLIFVVEPGNLLFAAIIWVVLGVNMGAGPFLFRSIMADVADHDHVESGSSRTGIYYAMLTMTNKVGYALAVGIAYPVLDWVGFVPGAQNAPDAELGLQLVYILPAAAVGFIVAAIMWNFPLDEEKQVANRRILADRAAARAAPLSGD